MAGINLNASIFDHPQLILQLLSIGRITIHKLFQSAYFSRVGLQALTNLIFKTFNFDVLVEIWQQILYFDYFALFGQLNHITYPALLH